jgi:hypothetical protein
MKVQIEMKDATYHRWYPVAVFEFGAQAMEAARALSEADGRTYRVIDYRWPEGKGETIIYENGIAS